MNPLEEEKHKLEKEIRQLENRQKILLNKKSDAERKARTRRLIERGAILESVCRAQGAGNSGDRKGGSHHPAPVRREGR